ncbi:hypothetical protein [Parendozoicomonas haliclonae]|uniref:Uncharacterized protein n=1 Tax=Parendozoicomonas haliclonae TaxID=1960125 RepID=A0A1X7AQB5_9GAMM|nr:hypothetical protein [Parendozoicomonas haliclonae]SMA50486.1 hypothetical protein EHSB41UT_04297 [Parendozoicomonas haliclonae]
MEAGKISLKTLSTAGTGGCIGALVAGLPGAAAGGLTGLVVGAAWAYLTPASRLPDIPTEHLDRRSMHLSAAVDDEMIHHGD